jgi:bifunctional DNase/RNase
MELVEVELVRVVIHQKGDQQFIHLRERNGNRGFPIVIGFNEVEEINRKLCGVQPPRPLTHDLVGRILSALGHRLHRVIINELREGTFYATLVLMPRDAGTTAAGSERLVDCRPSDAIALAVQTGAPILVAREVFEAVAADQ